MQGVHTKVVAPMLIFLPPTNAEFRVRASGPALCLGSVHWTDRPIELDAAVQVLHRTSDFLASSHRYVRLVLPLVGEYLLEAIQLYDAFNLTSHMRTTCTSADLTLALLAGGA
jgi:hypothetical protein